MKYFSSKVVSVMTAVSIITLGFAQVATAHVVVKPSEVVTAGFQTYSVSVPTERDVPTTKLKLLIPTGLTHVSPTVKPDWKITTTAKGSGEAAIVTAITWSDGSIPTGQRDDFSFSAKAPDTPTELDWKAYQTYADGVVVSWDKVPSSSGQATESETSGPLSVTNVKTELPGIAPTSQTVPASNTAEFALYTAIAGVVLSLAAIFVASRNRS